MVNKSTVRNSNKERFKRCIELRKQGLSYSEIQKLVSVSKSTLHSWLTFAKLTLTKEHLQIQADTWHKNHIVATEASRVTRLRKSEIVIRKTIQELNGYFRESLFVAGVMLYEAEGNKGSCRFSNSDFRLIQLFVKFSEKYFDVSKERNMKFCLYLHLSRSNDLKRILSFWSEKLNINSYDIKIFWKRNVITKRRENLDYVGQMDVSVLRGNLLTRKLRCFSDIILEEQLRNH